ncbi:hypothetical protein KUCAC02_031416, partial [Chaenocephalus aceratus]
DLAVFTLENGCIAWKRTSPVSSYEHIFPLTGPRPSSLIPTVGDGDLICLQATPKLRVSILHLVAKRDVSGGRRPDRQLKRNILIRSCSHYRVSSH